MNDNLYIRVMRFAGNDKWYTFASSYLDYSTHEDDSYKAQIIQY